MPKDVTQGNVGYAAAAQEANPADEDAGTSMLLDTSNHSSDDQLTDITQSAKVTNQPPKSEVTTKNEQLIEVHSIVISDQTVEANEALHTKEVDDEVDEETRRATEASKVGDFDYASEHQRYLQSIIPKVQILIPLLLFILWQCALINDSFTPALVGMAHDYHTTIEYMQAIIPYYFIGNGFGQLFIGPILDRFGRRIIIIVGVVATIALNLWMVNTDVYAHIVVIRLLHGFTFAGVSMLPSVLMRDVFTMRDFVRYNAILWTMFMFAPAIAPLFGGWIYVHWGWQAIFNIINVSFFLAGMLFLWKVPETLNPVHRQSISPTRVVKNFMFILSSFNSRMLLLIEIFFATAIFSFVSLFPGIALKEYHVNPAHVGWFTMFQLFAVACSIQVNQFLLGRGYSVARNWIHGIFAQASTMLINISCVVLYWRYPGYINEYVIAIVAVFNYGFNGFIGSNLFAMFLLPYPQMNGTASSLINSIAFLIPGLIITGLSHLPMNGGTTWMLINCACFCFILTLGLYFRARNRKLFVKPIKKPPEAAMASTS